MRSTSLSTSTILPPPTTPHLSLSSAYLPSAPYGSCSVSAIAGRSQHSGHTPLRPLTCGCFPITPARDCAGLSRPQRQPRPPRGLQFRVRSRCLAVAFTRAALCHSTQLAVARITAGNFGVIPPPILLLRLLLAHHLMAAMVRLSPHLRLAPRPRHTTGPCCGTTALDPTDKAASTLTHFAPRQIRLVAAAPTHPSPRHWRTSRPLFSNSNATRFHLRTCLALPTAA